jgi:hypothetical protein
VDVVMEMAAFTSRGRAGRWTMVRRVCRPSPPPVLPWLTLLPSPADCYGGDDPCRTEAVPAHPVQ